MHIRSFCSKTQKQKKFKKALCVLKNEYIYIYICIYIYKDKEIER